LNPLDMMFTAYETRNPQNEINDTTRYPIDTNVIPASSKSLAKIAPALGANQIYKSTDVLSIWEKITMCLKL